MNTEGGAVTNLICDSVNRKTYKRGSLLGKGAFGRCFEVVDTTTNEVYAGKIISKALVKKQNWKEKIIQEINIHKCLKHSHIVQFRGFFDDINNIYILLELCSKQSLLELLKRRQVLTNPEVRYYMKQALLAVQYLHSINVIHRDLKLGNILINESMEVKIGDFGFAAKIKHSGERKLTLCGTPNYIAPEILEKNGHGMEVDIWSFGCIMYTLLVGKPPFEGAGVRETYSRIKTCDYFIPAEMNPFAACMLRRIFVKDPRCRPSATMLLDEVYFTGYTPEVLPVSCLVMPPYYKNSECLSRVRTPLSQCNRQVLNSTRKCNQPLDGTSIIHLNNLKNQILSTLNKMPKEKVVGFDEENEDPVSQPIYWISSWVDYSDYFGFGYRLCDETVGVIFVDGSKLAVDSIGNIYYVGCDKLEKYCTLSSHPSKLTKKIHLYHMFKGYLNNLNQAGGTKPSSVESCCGRPPVLTNWIRYNNTAALLLSNGTYQINFFHDHSKIIACPIMGAMTFLEQNNTSHTYKFKHIEKNGCSEFLEGKLWYLYKKIGNMIDNKARLIVKTNNI